MASGKVLVVTGGGRGIGRAVALRFARDGTSVVAAARTRSELEQTQSLVKREGGQCHIVACDVGNEAEVHRLIDEGVKHFGRIDVLVNAAGVAPVSPIEQLTPEIFDNVWSANVRAMYLTSRAAWGTLKSTKGSIVNISSIASLDPFAGFAAYGASKAWVNAWTRGLAEEGRTQGVRVFSVAPAGVETGMLRGAFPDYPKDDTLDPEHVADMVYILSLPECRYATGQTVFIQRRGD